MAREAGGGRLTHPAVRREKAVPTPADMVRGGDPSEPRYRGSPPLSGNTCKAKESRDPSREGGALWLQPVNRPGQSKHGADMPGFGIKGWGKDDGHAGRVRELQGRYAGVRNKRVGQG